MTSKMYMFLSSIIFGHLITGSVGLYVFPVETLQWSVTNSAKNITVPATIPGGIYTDLMNGAVLVEGDFYYGYNDLNYRWVSYDEWTYETVLEVSQTLLDESNIVMTFEGLDTFASVSLDNNVVLVTDNMFVRYQIDVKGLLSADRNHTLSVRFKSPVTETVERDNDYFNNYGYHVVPECVVDEFHGECHANYARKMQAAYSWDWGPAFPGCGIWKQWSLIGWSSLQIDDILFAASPTVPLPTVPTEDFKPSWGVTTKIFLSGGYSTDLMGTLEVQLAGVALYSQQVDATNQSFLEASFVVPDYGVSLWWPNGYGNQSLYYLEVTWTSNGGEVANKKIKVGFRTVELDQSFVDESNETLGRHYRFKINNVIMFLKGSNWIPAHVLPEQVSADYTAELLEAAKLTNQNCLRVWGGGIYETDVFYEKADEFGLLIWEDLMFACSMYPTDPDYLDSIDKEMRTQIRRLQYHPSVLAWSSNNENEVALRGNWYGTKDNFSLYYNDYVQLYVDTIRTIVLEEDSTRDFIVSSPSNGRESEEEGYVAQDPYDSKYGDVHYYNYILDGWHWLQYPATRFASEYGFQSWPSFKTFSQVTDSADWVINSPMMEHRQHHPGGNPELDLQLQRHMIYDASTTSFEHYLYMTQIHQAMAIKIETEFYRRMRSTLNSDGSGLTMGALYWQLNDIWQGASWASLEFGGRWKMLHYYAKKFFEPILILPYVDLDKSLKVYIVNDEFVDLNNVEIDMKIYSYQMLDSHFSFNDVTTVPSEASSFAASLDVNFVLNNIVACQLSTFDPAEVCFVMVEARNNAGNRIGEINFSLLSEPKDSALMKANITASNVSGSSTTLTFDLHTDAVALFVWLESDYDGYFSDNGFIMVNSMLSLEFYAKDPVPSLTNFVNTLQITSLSDTY